MSKLAEDKELEAERSAMRAANAKPLKSNDSMRFSRFSAWLSGSEKNDANDEIPEYSGDLRDISPSLINSIVTRDDSMLGSMASVNGGNEIGKLSRENTFTRRMSQVLGFDPQSDEAWTKHLLDSYLHGEEKAERDGDIPMPAGFGREKRFWKITLLSCVMGMFMGVVGVGFMNAADYGPRMWVGKETFLYAEDCQFNAGKKRWILIVGGSGLLVGIARWLIDYPNSLPGLFAEIRDYHVEPKWSPFTFLLSMGSLWGGASLGPEQALSNLGGGMATYLAEHYLEERMDSDDKKLVVLSGMSGALGALFPTPLLAVLMIHELGNPPRAYMESIIILSSSACCSFAVYYILLKYTYCEHLERQLWLTYNWNFEPWQLGTAALMGIAAGVISLVSVIMIGVCKQIFTRIRLRLHNYKFLQSVLPSLIGGVIIGSINYALPLTVGGGTLAMQPVVKFGHNYIKAPLAVPPALAAFAEQIPQLATLLGQLPQNTGGIITPHLLLCTGFAKMFVLGVSMNCGFVGGFVFPTLLLGNISGVLFYQWFPAVPLGMCVSCFIAAVPAGICPMPFTLAGLAIFTLFNGLYQTVPIYIATLISYLMVCGSGIFTALQVRAIKQAEEAAKAKAARKAAKDGTAATAREHDSSSRENNYPKSTDGLDKTFDVEKYSGSKTTIVTTRRQASAGPGATTEL